MTNKINSMKFTIGLLLIFILVGCSTHSSNTKTKPNNTISKAVAPIFHYKNKSGQSAIYRYIQKELRYPKGVREEAGKKSKLKTIVGFTISSYGSVKNIKLLKKSISKQFNQEALRLIREMPDWTAGKTNGKPTAVKHTLPITLALE